jgi:hypothetical protein
MAKLDKDERNPLKGRELAFQKQRNEPLEDAGHARSAIARFNQIEGVNDDERAALPGNGSRLPQRSLMLK